MTLFLQNQNILSWDLRHVGVVGDFYPSLSRTAQIRGFYMLGVGVSTNLKPQLKKQLSKLSRAKVSTNHEVSVGGYSPYGRGQTLQCLPIPYGKASAREIKKNHQPTKGVVMTDHEHKKSKSLLALDLGRTTGWALLTPTAIHSGFETFKPSRFESSGMALLRFRSWLNIMDQQAGGLDVCFFEEVRAHKGTTAAHTYGEFLGQLKSWADDKETPIPYLGVPVGTIKKFATGKGNANKGLVIKAVREKFGHDRVTDHNEADALALLHWAVTEGPVQFEMKGVLR